METLIKTEFNVELSNNGLGSIEQKHRVRRKTLILKKIKNKFAVCFRKLE